jgi:endonuclease YncB( thermonuclease family)
MSARPGALLLLASIVLAAFCGSSNVHAQRNGALKGRIVDLTGDGIPIAKVTLGKDGRKYEIKTDNDGKYETTLPAGTYSLIARSDGFLPSDERRIKIIAGQTMEANVTMLVERKPISDPAILENASCRDVFGVDSCTSDVYTGKVIEVIDGRTMVVIVEKKYTGASLGKKEKHRVLLAGASVLLPEQPLGKEAKQKLAGLVLERTVLLVVFCPGWYKDGVLRATVTLRGKDVGQDLLESGLARLDSEGTDSYTRCNYQLAENRAKAGKRGLWAGQ